MGTSLGPHLISLLRGARWEGAPGSAGAGAVAADRRRAIARSRRLSSALSAARAAGGHRAAHREYGDVPLERSAAAVHAQTGCLSSWPELASPDREGVRRVGQMGGQRVEGLSGAAWSCCFRGRAALGLLVAHSPAGHVAERGDCVGWRTVCSCSSRKSAKSERRARRGLLVTSFVSRGLVTARVAEVRAVLSTTNRYVSHRQGALPSSRDTRRSAAVMWMLPPVGWADYLSSCG
jgi:hypothetical protein